MYDAHAPSRKAGGSKGARLFRNAENPNETIILLEWEDPEQARQFVQSADLRQAMQRAGVADQPDIYFLEEVQWTPA